MSILLHGDCLEELKSVDDNSIDLIFCDLPYVDSKGKGQTSCSWNQCPIDLDLFWIEVMRVKKLNTPIFFTTTTKYGVSLINSAPKKLKFFDLIWKKSASTGFLLAKKFPLRIHEMIYVFYEKLPFYDLSSHKHKFLNEEKIIRTDGGCDALYGKETGKVMIKDKDGKIRNTEPRYDPPLPVSIVKPNEEYDKREKKTRNTIKKEENYGKGYLEKKVNFRKYDPNLGATGTEGNIYDPPLPVSVVKEPEPEKRPDYQTDSELYGDIKRTDFKRKEGESMYSPPLPNSMLEIKSTRGYHSTEKPVALMSWILKYYSKEGDVVLDPTMGSGSMGVACKNMNRNFIGIEKDPEIYEVAVNRIEN